MAREKALRRHRLLTIGVTGGIGSGKSTVCNMLRDLGADIFDADSVAKDLMVDDRSVRREIIDAFGSDSYHSDGGLNRSYLATEVFSDPDKLATINSIVHPRVFDAFKQMCRHATSAGTTVLVHEAALLFEAGGYRHVDCTVYVDAPRKVRIARVTRRDGVSEELVKSRMRHQISAAEGRRRADYVLRNDADLEMLAERALRLVRRIERDFDVRFSEAALTKPPVERSR